MVWKFKLYPNTVLYCGFVLKGNYLLEMNGHKLFTRDRLLFIDDLSCVLCSGHLKSLDHLYFGCAFSTLLWFTVKEWLNIHYSMITIIVALKWFKRPYSWSSPTNLASHWAFSCTLYFIWKARNHLIFEGVCPNIDDIFFRVEVLFTNEFTCITPLRWLVLFWIRHCFCL